MSTTPEEHNGTNATPEENAVNTPQEGANSVVSDASSNGESKPEEGQEASPASSDGESKAEEAAQEGQEASAASSDGESKAEEAPKEGEEASAASSDGESKAEEAPKEGQEASAASSDGESKAEEAAQEGQEASAASSDGEGKAEEAPKEGEEASAASSDGEGKAEEAPKEGEEASAASSDGEGKAEEAPKEGEEASAASSDGEGKAEEGEKKQKRKKREETEEEAAERRKKAEARRKREALVQEITEKLEEPNITLTRNVVKYMGMEKCQQYLEKAIEMEAEGGDIIKSGDRRRTPGGIFYWLVKQELTLEELKTLFPYPQRPIDKERRKASRKKRKKHKKIELLAQVAESWESRAEAIKEVLVSKKFGQATSIKVTMIGRPGKIRKQRGFVMTTMRGPERAPSLPAELPKAPASKLVYLVYIGNKQWKRVAKRITNPEDILIIEGYLSYDKALKKMTVFGQMVTTKLIQQERRKAQKDEAEKKKAEEAKAQAQATAAAKRKK